MDPPAEDGSTHTSVYETEIVFPSDMRIPSDDWENPLTFSMSSIPEPISIMKDAPLCLSPSYSSRVHLLPQTTSLERSEEFPGSDPKSTSKADSGLHPSMRVQVIGTPLESDSRTMQGLDGPAVISDVSWRYTSLARSDLSFRKRTMSSSAVPTSLRSEARSDTVSARPYPRSSLDMPSSESGTSEPFHDSATAFDVA